MAEIPCVVVNVQRGGPSTGIPTHVSQGDVFQARWGTHGDHAIVVLTASSHQDVFAMTVEAFNIAETYRTPVILLFDEVVGHMREQLDIPEPGAPSPWWNGCAPRSRRAWTTIPTCLGMTAGCP